MGKEDGRGTLRVVVLCVGVFARIFAGLSSSTLRLRNTNYVAPIHSVHKLRECSYLMQENHSAYEGDACHHNPLSILLLRTFENVLNHPVYGDFSFLMLFVLLDVLSGFLIYSFANGIVGKGEAIGNNFMDFVLYCKTFKITNRFNGKTSSWSNIG